MADLTELKHFARSEFADIVVDVYRIDAKLRILLIDESYLDSWWSEVQAGRFVHHWNRQNVDGSIYRHDNAPHRRWAHISTPSALPLRTGRVGDQELLTRRPSGGGENVSRILPKDSPEMSTSKARKMT
jgi:hypothetical protein